MRFFLSYFDLLDDKIVFKEDLFAFDIALINKF